MKVLVIGSGGREHAITWKLAQSRKITELYCAPGNPGIGGIATNVDIPVTNIGALALWALENKIDLTVVGPEEPLSLGVVDAFQEHGLKIFGPTKAAAQLESSKIFSKDVMLKAGVPTPRGGVFTEFEEAKDFVLSQGAPIVVKADGLAAGKGVVVATTTDEAIAALDRCMLQGSLGEAGRKVIIEECIDGEEASIIALVEGDVVLPLVLSQDYKRLNDGATGPNTGGMGAISPTPVLGEHRLASLVKEIFIPVLSELRRRGITYRGFLYAGAMVDKTGQVKVIEFNCRGGDPETEVLMMRLESDLVDVLERGSSGALGSVALEWKKEAAATVIMSSRGYTATVDDGKEISGLFPAEKDLVIFQAGTRAQGDKVLSKGGRVLAVTALGETVEQAVRKAYSGVQKISFEGMHYRKDIGGRK